MSLRHVPNFVRNSYRQFLNSRKRLSHKHLPNFCHRKYNTPLKRVALNRKKQNPPINPGAICFLCLIKLTVTNKRLDQFLFGISHGEMVVFCCCCFFPCFFEDRSLLLAAVKEDGRLLRLAPLTPLGKPVGMDWKGGVPGKPELPQKRGV